MPVEPTVSDVTILVLFGILAALWLATVIPQGRALDMHDFYLRFLVGSNRRLVSYIRQLHIEIGVPFPQGLEDLSELPELPSRWRQRLGRLRHPRRRPAVVEVLDVADAVPTTVVEVPVEEPTTLPEIPVVPGRTDTVPDAVAVTVAVDAVEAAIQPDALVTDPDTAHFLANLEESYRSWRADLDAGSPS